MKKNKGPKKCCLKMEESLLAVLRCELKESKDLAEFSLKLDEFQTLLDLMKDASNTRVKRLYLKHGVGCKTCKLKNTTHCRECLLTSRKVYYKNL